MKILICIDDTDDLTKSTSTGTIAELISGEMERLGGVLEQGISRHQLLLHKDIEYTSHNSSMCFILHIDGVEIPKIQETAALVLRENMAESADPGICICRLDRLTDAERLIRFGRRAQKEVLTKKEAYTVAKEVGGVYLEEYGGTGCGVIGALAGIGLRLCGCDGTIRGKNGVGGERQTLSAGELCAKLGAEQIIDKEGNSLDTGTMVYIEKFAKLVLLDHKVTVVVKKNGKGGYEVCKKSDLYDGDKSLYNLSAGCPNFVIDNDEEECRSEEEKACYNCLYRRWTEDGFICANNPSLDTERNIN